MPSLADVVKVCTSESPNVEYHSSLYSVTESPPVSTVTACHDTVRDDPSLSALSTSLGTKTIGSLGGLGWLFGDADAMVENAPKPNELYADTRQL